MCLCYEHEGSVDCDGGACEHSAQSVHPRETESFPSECVYAMRDWEGNPSWAALLSGDV